MGSSVGKKLSFIVGLAVLVSTGIMGAVSYRLMDRQLAGELRKDTLDAASLLSSRVRNEMKHIAEKGRLLSAAALEEFKSSEDQIRFLEDNLLSDDQLIALTLYRRSGASQNRWVPVFRITRPESDPAYLSETDFKSLDTRYPLDWKSAAQGAVEVSWGALSNNTPILRMTVPISKRKDATISQVLGIEIRQERITAAFAEATAQFSFLLDRNGHVLVQTDPTHFTFGEDLSQFPLVQRAANNDGPTGSLDYRELPGGMLQYGSYSKVGFGGLTVVSQASRAAILQVLKNHVRQGIPVALACVFAMMAFALLACWSVVGARLRRMAQTFKRLSEGKYGLNFPDRGSTDEIGDFAQAMQEACDRLQQREKVHGTYAKLKGKRAKTQIDEGKLNCRGERLKAVVLHCHLRGIEPLVEQADPEQLLGILNTFNQAVTRAVEGSKGMVDHIHGGSVVAYWGVPFADKEDCDHALSTSLEIRKAFKTLTEALKIQGLPELSLAVGIHCGTVVAGQAGCEDRLEYTAFGEAIEVASRIQAFGEQFGTDIILTGAVLAQAPQWYRTEKITSADESNPDLYELVSKARQIAPPKTVEEEEDTPLQNAA